MANTFSTTNAAPAVAPGGTITLADARAWVRQFARNAGSSAMYEDADVDRAIKTVGDRFCRETRCVRSTGTVGLSAGTATFSAAAVTTFRADRMTGAWLDGVADPLERTDYDTPRRMGVTCPSTGVPRQVGFQDGANGIVFPVPDDAYTLNLRHWQPFTAWTVGTSNAAAINLNIPADWVGPVLTYGAPATLQHNEPEAKYASASWRKYLEAEAEAKLSAGSLGVRVVPRDMME